MEQVHALLLTGGSAFGRVVDPRTGGATTIGVIAASAVLTKAQAHKIAPMALDGLARSIYPVHTLTEGDTLFALATGHSGRSPR